MPIAIHIRYSIDIQSSEQEAMRSKKFLYQITSSRCINISKRIFLQQLYLTEHLALIYKSSLMQFVDQTID